MSLDDLEKELGGKMKTAADDVSGYSSYVAKCKAAYVTPKSFEDWKRGAKVIKLSQKK